MKVFIDTNIIVSAVLKPNSSPQIMTAREFLELNDCK